jgi:hypothetical protein
MKRWFAGSALIVLGLLVVMVAAVGAAAQTTGTCYVVDTARDCSSVYTAQMSCDACLTLGFPDMSWQGDGGCVTNVGGCPDPTPVTFMGFSTPITRCNASSVVPGLALVGMIVAAGGLVVLKRRERAS